MMKYLVLALTLIFSMSGSVNADNHNTRYVLIFSGTVWIKSPFQIMVQSGGDYENQTYQTEAECYEGLKKVALRNNKTNKLFQGEDRFIIEIVNKTKITAKAMTNPREVLTQIHCLKVTLD